MKIIYNNIIPVKGFSAINLFGFVFSRKECAPLSESTINHERIHTAQMKELLYVFFYLFYLLEWLIKLFRYGKRSYYNISFEREAYSNEYDASYLRKRKRYSFLKHI